MSPCERGKIPRFGKATSPSGGAVFTRAEHKLPRRARNLRKECAGVEWRSRLRKRHTRGNRCASARLHVRIVYVHICFSNKHNMLLFRQIWICIGHDSGRVELVIADSKYNELCFPMPTWKLLLQHDMKTVHVRTLH